jgi:hypothetical protein
MATQIDYTAFDALRQSQDETDRRERDAAILALCASSDVREIWERPDVVETVENFAQARDNELRRIEQQALRYAAFAEADYRRHLAKIESDRKAAVVRAFEMFESRQRGFVQYHAGRVVDGRPPQIAHMFKVNVGASRLGILGRRAAA